jgi:transcriptional regulator with XRE-family HTH domain
VGVSSPSALLREARRQAGLSQAQLARRLGVSQAAVAKLERRNANPTVGTLDRALRATGRHLRLQSVALDRSVDETLIQAQLELTPAERLAQLEAMYEWGRELTLTGAKARGELDRAQL